MSKFKIDNKGIQSLLSTILVNTIDDTKQDLQETAPVDDSTPAKAEYIYKTTGQRIWIKDDVESRKQWERTKIRKRKEISGGLSNNHPAAIALSEGFISPLNINAEKVERVEANVPGGLSEQDPSGEYAVNSMKRALRKNKFTYLKIKK